VLRLIAGMAAIMSPTPSSSSLSLNIHVVQHSDWRLCVIALLPALVALGVGIGGWRMVYRSGLEAQREAARLEMRRTAYDYLNSYLENIGTWLLSLRTTVDQVATNLHRFKDGEIGYDELTQTLGGFVRRRMEEMEERVPPLRSTDGLARHAAVFPFSAPLVRELELVGVDSAVSSAMLLREFYRFLEDLSADNTDGIPQFIKQLELGRVVAEDYMGMCRDVQALLHEDYLKSLYREGLTSTLPHPSLTWAEAVEGEGWKPKARLRLMSFCLAHGVDDSGEPDTSEGVLT
jgi:hypothetical protein